MNGNDIKRKGSGRKRSDEEEVTLEKTEKLLVGKIRARVNGDRQKGGVAPCDITAGRIPSEDLWKQWGGLPWRKNLNTGRWARGGGTLKSQ